MVVNVFISAVTSDNLSRKEAVAWVNDTLKSHFTKVEEMSSGAAYCQMTHFLFRNSINLKKVKFNPRNEPDILSNWKLLTTTWKQLGIDKPVDVEKLKKGKFQDNMEFLQWFYKFFNANYVIEDVEYDAVAERNGEDLPALKGPAGAARPAVRAAPVARPAPVRTAPAVQPVAQTSSAPATVKAKPAPAAPQNNALLKENEQLKKTIAELEEYNNQLINDNKEMEAERNNYYEMMLRVESLLLNNENESKTEVSIDAIKNIIYAADDDNQNDANTEDNAELQTNGERTLVAEGLEADVDCDTF